MQTITDVLSTFPKLSLDQLNALIALGALALAAFAIYTVLTIARGTKQ